MDDIELFPGISFCGVEEFNRISRQQGLPNIIARAAIFDEICHSVELDHELENELLEKYCQELGMQTENQVESYLKSTGLTEEDLKYQATRLERLNLFKLQLFNEDVELRFLDRKRSIDCVNYSLIRLQDADLAFELYQRLIEAEESFDELVVSYSEGPERETGGRIGPVPLSQAHPDLMNLLRTSNIGQIREPVLINDMWIIARLDDWNGARLNEDTRKEILEELFDEWIAVRTAKLLAGKAPESL